MPPTLCQRSIHGATHATITTLLEARMTRSCAELTALTLATGLLLVSCATDAPDPIAVTLVPSADARAEDAGDAPDADDANDIDDDAENPIVARVNLDVTLRGDGHGHGHIKFRQPPDAFFIVFLDTRVRGLEPNTDYQLQRAVDTVVDDNCTSQTWLTLGQLTAPLLLHTDARGKGQAQFSRQLTSPAGTEFDIHFQVIDAVTKAVVLHSGCYQFKVSQ